MSSKKSFDNFIFSSAGGYLNNICASDQPKAVDTVLRCLFTPVPFVLLITSSICLYFYPITSESVKETTMELQNMDRKRKSIAEAARNNEAFAYDNDTNY